VWGDVVFGFDVDCEVVEVGVLFDVGCFDFVCYFEYW